MVSVHTYPPSQPVPIKFDQKKPFDVLTHAYIYVCDQFAGLLSQREMVANIDARVLLLWARDAVVGEREPFQGEMISSLEHLVKKVERR